MAVLLLRFAVVVRRRTEGPGEGSGVSSSWYSSSSSLGDGDDGAGICRSVSFTNVISSGRFLVDGAPLNFLPRLATLRLPENFADDDDDDDDNMDGGCCIDGCCDNTCCCCAGGDDGDGDRCSDFNENDILRVSWCVSLVLLEIDERRKGPGVPG